MVVIKDFLKKDDTAGQINLQTAIGLEQKQVGSESVQRKERRPGSIFLVAQVLPRSTNTIWSTLM